MIKGGKKKKRKSDRGCPNRRWEKKSLLNELVSIGGDAKMLETVVLLR
jgi:hypothetical protein